MYYVDCVGFLTQFSPRRLLPHLRGVFMRRPFYFFIFITPESEMDEC